MHLNIWYLKASSRKTENVIMTGNIWPRVTVIIPLNFFFFFIVCIHPIPSWKICLCWSTTCCQPWDLQKQMQHYLNFQFGSFLRKTYDRMFQSLKKLTVGTFQTTSHGDHKIFKGFSRSSKKHSKNYFFEYQSCRQKGKIISKRFDQSFCFFNWC